MLVVTRKKDQKIIMTDGADSIEIVILGVERHNVRFGINAPKHIIIHTRLTASPAPEEPIAVVEQKTEAGVSR